MQIAPQDMAPGECYEPYCPVRFHEEAHRQAGYNCVTAFTLALSDSPWYAWTFRYCWDGPGPNRYRSAEGIGTPDGALF